MLPIPNDDPQEVQEPNNKVDIELVNELLDWCYDNTFINKMRGTTTRNNLLHWACEKGLLQIVEHLFIENRFDNVNCVGSNMETPLHKASKYGRIEVVKYLINKGANVNAKNQKGETPLHLQIENFRVHLQSPQSFVEVAKLLIENGGEVNCKDMKDRTPLYLVATRETHTPEFSDAEALKYEEINLEMAKYLIQQGAQPNTKSNAGGFSALHILSIGVLVESVKINHARNITKLLIENGEGVNLITDDGKMSTPLHLALNDKCIEYAKILISHGANVNAMDSTGDTPFYIAIKKGYFEIAEDILTNWTNGTVATNLNRIEDKGYLQQAAAKGHFKVCQLLISLGANIGLQDTEGNTPLLNATKNIKEASGHFDIVKMLLDKGASPNIANNEKNVPLHFAKSKELAELLLKNGAKTELQNNQNQTPKDLAFQNKLQEINELMIQYETRATDKELNNCIICFNLKNGTFAFLPCGHAKTCENCCKSILQPANQQHECPTCRQPVTNYHKIFI